MLANKHKEILSPQTSHCNRHKYLISDTSGLHATLWYTHIKNHSLDINYKYLWILYDFVVRAPQKSLVKEQAVGGSNELGSKAL